MFINGLTYDNEGEKNEKRQELIRDITIASK